MKVKIGIPGRPKMSQNPGGDEESASWVGGRSNSDCFFKRKNKNPKPTYQVSHP